MKKGLLLSIVASTVLFAGGDIAPVEPVAEAPAAACNDFYGQVGAAVVYVKEDRTTPVTEVVNYGVGAILGVSKEIFSGLTVNAELQGAVGKTYDVIAGTTGATVNRANLTQLNLGYSFCNTAIKVGRFAIDMGLSPLVFTDTDSLGLSDITFDGAMIANTDIPDTVVYGAYIYRVANHKSVTGTTIGTTSTGAASFPMGSVDGVAAVGFQNKSLADTTITGIGYYAVTSGDYMGAGSIDKKWCDTDISLGGAYQDIGGVTSYVVGGYVTQHFGAFDAMIAATYGDMGYAKYTWKTYQAAGTGTDTWAVGAKLSTTISGFKVWGTVGYNELKDYQLQAGIGKTVKGIDLSTDIRYRYDDSIAAAYTRVRARAIYKF